MNFIVAESHPKKYPRNTNPNSFKVGYELSLDRIRKMIAQTIKMPILYSAQDLYDLLISYV